MFLVHRVDTLDLFHPLYLKVVEKRKVFLFGYTKTFFLLIKTFRFC